MPLAFNNLVTQPANSALNNKLNPNPYGFLFPKTSVTTSSKSTVPTGAITGSNLNSAISNLNTANSSNPAIQINNAKNTTTSSVKTPTTQNTSLDSDTYKKLLVTNIQGQIKDKQDQLKAQQDQEAKAQETTTTPEDTLKQGGVYGQLIGQGLPYLSEAAKVGGEAGKLRQLMETTKQNIMGDRNYAGSVRIGQAGLIDQNLGTQLSGLSAQQQALQGEGNAYLSAAGMTKSSPEGYPFVFNPNTGKYEDVSGGKYGDGVVAPANIQTAKNFAGDYQEGVAKLKAADAIQNQIVGTLQSNPTLNSTPLSSFTNLKEILSGQVSSGPQQLLSQQISQYLQTLGLDPGTVFQIAHQQQGTLAQLLDSLRKSAQATVDSKNPDNLNFNNASGNGGSSSNDPLGIRQ